MPRIRGRFKVYRRKDTKNYIVSLSPVSGLPEHICREWDRKGFNRLPAELANLRNPKSKSAAESAADALIIFLKKSIESENNDSNSDITVAYWLKLFTSLENNPRSQKLMSAGSPYSPQTIKNYKSLFETHLKDDPFMDVKMVDIVKSDVLIFLSRVGQRKLENGNSMTGTRTYESIISFLKMAFNEYEEENQGWYNHFRYIKKPKGRKPVNRDSLIKEELVILLNSLTDPLQKAVCAALFGAGLRRSEVFSLMPEDLDWQFPRIKVVRAWKSLNAKNKVLGLPKWNKKRETIFPDFLQEAILNLWKVNGKHKFVFCDKDGNVPASGYLKYWFPRWLKNAGINTENRNIVPHSARHTFASILEADGVPLRYIQDILGHSNYKTTSGYLHTPADSMNKIGAKMCVDILNNQIQAKTTKYKANSKSKVKYKYKSKL